MNSSVDINYIIALSFFEGIGPMRFRLLKEYFGSARAVFTASEQDLLTVGLPKTLVSKFISFKKSRDISTFYARIRKQNIHVITEDDRYFPAALREIKGAPFILYGLGDISLLNGYPAVAVVGTRKPSPYGKEITKQLADELARAGVVVTSGMAMGVDAIAHQAALDAGGKTIAVLGCGVDICYPPVNYALYKKIIQGGLVLSEFPPGMRSSRGVFPSRNRIVAGISKAVVVTEGAEGSGALITAEFAAEYGRDVYAVPGPVTSPLSFAANYLLKHGARIATNATDILSEYSMAIPKQVPAAIPLTKEESQIIELIKYNNPLHIDEISRNLHISVADLSVQLAALTIKGALQEMETGEYTIKT